MENNTTALASWRYGGEENFSDWTLIVNGVKYFVHKVALIHPSGARQCRYFSPLFKGKTRFQEITVQASSIDFDELAASLVPNFLDYVYTGTTTVDHASVVGLRFLATYFDCPDFFRSDCYTKMKSPDKMEDILSLFQDTVRLQDTDYQDNFLALALSKIMSFTARDKQPLIDDECYSPELLMAFASTLLPKTQLGGTHYDIVAQYFSSVKHILRAAVSDTKKRKAMFQEFCVEDRLPIIAEASAASVLLFHESTLTDDGLGDTLSPLQHRCLDVLKTQSDFEELTKYVVLDNVKTILNRKHPRELWCGPIEIIADCLAAREDDGDIPAEASTEVNAEEEEEVVE